MQIYLDDSPLEVESNRIRGSSLLKEVRSHLEDKIIDCVFLDEEEFTPREIKENDFDLGGFEEIRFKTRRTEDLMEETLREAGDYLPQLAGGLLEAADLYRTDEISRASTLLEECLQGIEWYVDVSNKILNLISDQETAAEGRNLLQEFNQTVNRALIVLKNESYTYLAEILKDEVYDYLEKFKDLNSQLLSGLDNN